MLFTPMQVKIARITAGISQKDFARLIGKSQNAYNRWERGKSCSFEIAVKATEYFNNHASTGGSHETQENSQVTCI